MTRRFAIACLIFTLATCRTAAPGGSLPPNFGVVREGAIYRGGQPAAGQLAALHRLGVRTIVKLNGDRLDGERREAEALGMRLIHIPMSARTIGEGPTCAAVRSAFEAMIDRGNGAVFVHCSRGRDRTGFLVGLFRERVDGWTFEQVSEELARYGHNRAMRTVFPNISRSLRSGFAECPSR